MMAKVEAEAKKFMYGDEEITHESFLEDTSAMFGANGKEMVEAFDKLFVALDADKSNSITVCFYSLPSLLVFSTFLFLCVNRLMR